METYLQGFVVLFRTAQQQGDDTIAFPVCGPLSSEELLV
jgi:hypothetical protein